MKKEERQQFAEKFTQDSIFVQTTDDDLSPFDSNRIVAVLLNETGIDYKLAVKISEEIEKTIYASGLEVVTSEFVRELVNTKLLEYDLDKAREKNKRLGLSLYDVGRLLKFPIASSPNSLHSPLSTTKIISENVKRQFVLSQLYNEELINSHIKGDYHIQGISHPDKIVECYIDVFNLKEFSFASGSLIIEKATTIDEFIDNLIKMHFQLSDFVKDRINYINFEKIFEIFKINYSQSVDLLKKFISNVSNSHSDYSSFSIYLESKKIIKNIVEFLENKKYLNVEIRTKFENYFESPFLSIFNKNIQENAFFGEVVTLNLPRLALKTIEDKVNLDLELGRVIEKIVNIFSLKQLYLQRLLSVKPLGTFEFLKKFGLNFESLKFGIALNGLNEWGRAIVNTNIDAEKSISHCLKFLAKIRKKINEYKTLKKIKIKLMSSAQENVSHKFARLDLKFYSYIVGKIANGSITDSSIYYTRDCCLPSNLAVPIEKKIKIESDFQDFYDIPFKTLIKSINNDIVKKLQNISKTKYLSLTYDFSLCYNCILIKEGVFSTCPKCFGTNLERYSCSYNGYYPVNRVNKAFKEESESYFYYI